MWSCFIRVLVLVLLFCLFKGGGRQSTPAYSRGKCLPLGHLITTKLSSLSGSLSGSLRRHRLWAQPGHSGMLEGGCQHRDTLFLVKVVDGDNIGRVTVAIDRFDGEGGLRLEGLAICHHGEILDQDVGVAVTRAKGG